MKNTSLFRRFLSVVLVLAMVGSMMVPAATAETTRESATTQELELIPIDAGTLESHKLGKTEAPDASQEDVEYAATDVVRVSIVLDKASTMDAGFQLKGIAANVAAKDYREGLRADQTSVTAKIEKAIGSRLDVQWNLTLVANIISANVKYGQIETIKAVDGVQDVFLEAYYEAMRGEENADQPMQGSATTMTGSEIAWADGYTGAGSRLAILDTGVDIMHQSFDADALEYALRQNAEAKGVSYDAYVESLNLLTKEKIEAVKDQLNANKNGDFDASKAYHSMKIPFMFNYSNKNYEASNANDKAGNHGSHVAGISAANRFIKDGADYKHALEEVLTQGVAPDAQILDMDVFEDAGGTYESNYMAAIEDAIILGCDSSNLSLGSAASGEGFSSTYEPLMNKLVENDMVCAIAMGNSYMWFDFNTGANADMYTGYLYADDVGFFTGGKPATYTNSLAVASSDNIGITGMPLHFGDLRVFFRESLADKNNNAYGNPPILDTLKNDTYDYVLVDGPGVVPLTDADDDNGVTAIGTENDAFAQLGSAVLSGKVVLCYRGSSSFFVKVNAAAAQGAAAVIIINRDDATNFYMQLTGLDKDHLVPAVLVSHSDGEAIKAQSNAVEGAVPYYTGTMSLPTKMELVVRDKVSDTVEVSDFSSYGVPGTLVMKPEILAPGGGIYSVYGALPGEAEHNQYVDMSGTSMATPQINGLAGVLAQYIRENDLCTKTGLSQRQLINSLLMSTAHPVYDADGNYWPVIRVGAGHANVADAVAAKSYIMMDENATLFPDSAKDGKVKAELGDDPKHTGKYEFSFTVYPMDGKKDFALRTDIFTQGIAGNGGYGLLQDTATMLIGAETSYEVNGETYEDVYYVEADVNMDGKTDAADAQAILDKLTGALAEDAKFDETVADVDGDGEISSYDAKLLLDSATSPVITATEPTKVTVRIKLDEADRDYLLSKVFTKGFYVQGYTYVQPVADEEGVLDVVHSIPVLGFCGSWTDPAMLDRTSVLEEAYGIGKRPYMGKTNINYMTVTDANDASYVYMGNPYMVEESFHPERLAMQSNITIASFTYLPIRNAFEVGYALTDADGKVLDATLGSGRYAPYFGQSAGTWQLTAPATYKVGKNLSAVGVKEGDKVTLGFYALPEYIAMAAAKLDGKVSTTGKLGSKDGFKTALEAGLIGDGAGIKYELTIDDTAPVITGAMRDFVTGDFTIKAKDENYIAYVAVMNKNGTNAFAEAVPEQTAAGEEVQTLLKVGGEKIPGEIVILVGDYAGNESAYRVNLGGEQENLSGSVFAFTSAASEPGKGHRMLKIDPETVTYNKDNNTYTGLSVAATTSFAVEAAEYVEGYIFLAGSNGNFYAMDTKEMGETELIASFSNVTSTVYDMAYNVQDQQLYVMGDNNTVYTMDITSGKLTKLAEITVTNPRNAASTKLKNLAIDGKGNFYSANSTVPSGNYGSLSSAETYLYTFTLDMIDGEAKIQNLAPVNNTTYGSMYVVNCEKGGSMAWDHNTDQLYMIANYRATSATGGFNSTVDIENALYAVDVATGKTTRVNAAGETVGSGYSAYDSSAVLYSACSGLIIVPASTGPIKPTEKPDAVSVEPGELTMLKGTETQLTASVTPWTLTNKEVTWKSNDETIAKVNDTGVVTAVSFGETTITVTTQAKPSVSVEVPVSVVQAPVAELRGVIWDADGKGVAARFNSNEPNAWESEKEVGNFFWGCLVDDVFYGSDNANFMSFDADTYEVTKLAPIKYVPTDACAMPEDLRAVIAMFDVGDFQIIGTYGNYLLMYNAETYDDESGMLPISLLPEDANGNVIDSTFKDDYPATIAFGGYSDDHAINFFGMEIPFCPVFYIMTDSGAVYKLYFTYDILTKGISSDKYEKLGDTGIDLSGSTGSMFYSEENDFLYVTRYSEDEAMAYIHAINASDPSQNTEVGDFNKAVWPVVGLYEFEPATDLVLRVTPDMLYLDVGDTADVDVRVKLGQTNEYTFEVADPAVCSFENGVVTALAEGETTITFTTVDVNKNGEHVSKQLVVSVEDPNQSAPTDNSMYLFADFEQNADGWTFVDADGDGNNWKWNNEYPYGVDYSNDIAVYPSGNNSLDWAITPPIDLTKAVAPELSLYARVSYCSDSITIYAGTSDDTAAMTKVSDEMIPADAITEYTFDLSEYFSGLTEEQKSNVYIAILHNGGDDAWMIAVDNVCVREKSNSNQLTAAKAEFQQLLEKNLTGLESIQSATFKKTTKASVGSTYAIKGEIEKAELRAIENETTQENGKVHVVLSEDQAVTNGLFTVSYDPAVLTFESCDSTLLYKSFHNDAEKGVVTFAYASKDTINAETVLTSIDFSFKQNGVPTEIVVTTSERNDNTAVKEDALVIPVHGCKITHFTDIDHYPHGTIEHEAIEWAYTHEPCQVTVGTSATTFTPDDVVTKAMALTFLWAAAGKPTPDPMPDVSFTDAKEGDYWYTPVMWAYSKGIIVGNGDGTFGAYQACMRAHVLQMFYAAEGKPELTGETHFNDVTDNWFAPGANWAFEQGIELGDEDGNFNAYTPCTRVQVVVYLYKYYSQIVEKD